MPIPLATEPQALYCRMGGNPFRPAGTGKTESVKALGAQLERFVVVMNCELFLPLLVSMYAPGLKSTLLSNS